jgi:AraC-like DNA-binding protein
VDALSDLLDGARARSGLFNQTVLDPPWSLRIADRAPLSIATMLRGSGWLVPDAGDPLRLAVGDMAIMRGPDPYTVADDPSTEPQWVVHPGGRCESLSGDDLREELHLDTRTHGASPDGSTVIISGTYQLEGDVSARLLTALPHMLVVPADDIPGSVVEMVAGEVARDQPGQQVVLDRLLDLALLTTLRAWFARPEAAAPGWYSAQRDPVVGHALRLLHDRPADPWTVEALARDTGVSRAAFARRFTALVGEPPMAYLTSWRMALAGDLLRGTDATVETIARRVGYSNAFALSVAFKRLRGTSPSKYRTLDPADLALTS